MISENVHQYAHSFIVAINKFDVNLINLSKFKMGIPLT